MEREEIDRRFAVKTVSESQWKREEEVQTAIHALAHLLNALCPDSREKSLALTSLEETVHWATDAIARNEVK